MLGLYDPTTLTVRRTVVAPTSVRFHLAGELDVAGVPTLDRDVHVTRADATPVLVDLGGVTFCDVVGARELLRMLDRLEDDAATVSVTAVSRPVTRILGLLRLHLPATVRGIPTPRSAPA